jgi:hypothetical protein
MEDGDTGNGGEVLGVAAVNRIWPQRVTSSLRPSCSGTWSGVSEREAGEDAVVCVPPLSGCAGEGARG